MFSDRSFDERARLFALPASSWADYDEALISPGGGVFPRAAKSISLSPEVRTALAQRSERLVDCGLARRRQGQAIFARDLLDTLTRRELADAATQIARQTGLAYRPVEEGDHVSGIYRRRVDLASGRFALIEDGHQFLLVPWRPIVDRQLGREVSGVLRGGSISWNLGRERGLGI